MRDRILIADDEEQVRSFLAIFVKDLNYDLIFAEDGVQALDLIRKENPDLVLMDINMPGINGIDVCRQVKSDARLCLIPVVLITSLDDIESRVMGLSAGADDFFSKPFEQSELRARIRSLLTLKRHTDELERVEAVITSLALCVEAKDPYTAGHCERLSHYAVGLGKILGLSGLELRALKLGGILHDIGKIAIPDTILLKPSSLTLDERDVIEKHPDTGAHLCQPLKTLSDVIPVIKHHHEKWNGSGYPTRLKGEEIPVTARIVAVVDVFDALHTERSYKPAFSVEESIRILSDETDKGFWDPDVVRQFCGFIGEKGPKF